MMLGRARVSRDDALAVNQWKVSKEAHIAVDQAKCSSCEMRPCLRACPAGCYREREGKITVEYEACLECGTCRIICPLGSVSWTYPEHGRGVEYRFT